MQTNELKQEQKLFSFRTHKENKFTTIDNQLINNSELTWEAKGLLIYLLSKPENWQVRIADLVNRSKNGRDCVYRILKELKQERYIKQECIKDIDTKRVISYIYHVFEVPYPKNNDNANNIIDMPLTGKPLTGKPYTAEPFTEIPTLSNINLSKIDLYKNQSIKESISQSVNESEKAEYITCLNSELTDDFLKGDLREEEKISDKEQYLIDDLIEDPFLFSLEDAQSLIKKYSFDKVEYFTRLILIKKEQGYCTNPPGLLRHELKKNEFTTLKTLEPVPVASKSLENKYQAIYEYFRQKKIIAQAMQEYQKQEEITKFMLRKYLYFVSKNDEITATDLINLIGDISEIASIEVIKNLLHDGLSGKLTEENVYSFIEYCQEVLA